MIQTFYLKKSYVVHYRNLNFFFNNGIKIAKVHQAVNFLNWNAFQATLHSTRKNDRNRPPCLIKISSN